MKTSISLQIQAIAKQILKTPGTFNQRLFPKKPKKKTSIKTTTNTPQALVRFDGAQLRKMGYSEYTINKVDDLRKAKTKKISKS